MMDVEKLEARRSKGIVWVCDVIGSSKYLNDDESAGDVEEFLFRLHWLSSFVVRSVDGLFIKWTGDGFLAWFETPLYREAKGKARIVYQAATQLSFLVWITQLGISPKRRFEIRHSVTYEHDALITRIKYRGGYESLDILGRAVVLAFRLCSIRVKFPYVVTHGELISGDETKQSELFKFERIAFKPDDILRYFKGERWETNSIYKLVRRKWRNKDISQLSAITSNLPNEQELVRIFKDSFGIDVLSLNRLFENIASGPDWCRELHDKYLAFLREEILEMFRMMDGAVEKPQDELLAELKRFSKNFREKLDIQ